MKSAQTRVNSRAARPDAKDDAVSLATFLAKGLAILIASAFVLNILDDVADLAERTSSRILPTIEVD